MKRKILEYLICPACLPEENPLRLGHSQSSGGEISEGVLECGGCRRAYPIKGGVAALATHNVSSSPESLRYEAPDFLSAYLWSHYADLFEDPDATGAYSEWAGQISPVAGAALDAGCAAGRFCFEMSLKCDLVIGVDLSESFISMARRIMEQRKLSFRLKEEGRIHSERAFVLPARWDSSKVEFIVADAGALPFRSGSFSCVASLNLIDKIPHPLEHILEASRSARPSEAQLLISDPFSWSEAVCSPDRWLGGAPDGRFAGAGIDNVARLLSGEDRPGAPAWKIARRGAVWWKIRHHANHFELIRSLFVKAER
jgi:SAM-dependent methyltransferase